VLKKISKIAIEKNIELIEEKNKKEYREKVKTSFGLKRYKIQGRHELYLGEEKCLVTSF